VEITYGGLQWEILMCGMCPDYVASCWICTQPMRGFAKGSPDKTIGKQFYLEMGTQGKFCEHFIERYKTDSPCMYEHVRVDHSQEDENYKDYWIYDCEENCVAEGWHSEENLRAVVDAFSKWGE
jgi:hypothetical protein